MSWSDFDKKAKEASGGSFIKLKDGDEVVGVFRGEPYTFYQEFKSRIEYPYKVEGASFKFRVNFVIKSKDGYVAKILQGGATMAEQISACKDEYGLDCIYKIKRKGSGKDDTTYSVLFKSELTPAQKKELASVELLSLTSEKKQSSHPAFEEAPLPEDMPADQEEIDDQADVPF